MSQFLTVSIPIILIIFTLSIISIITSSFEIKRYKNTDNREKKK